MLIVYDTLTNNVKRFVHKLPYKSCHINEYDGFSPFILVTYTINFGQIPESTELFLNKYNKNMLGVSSSGNKNWGGYYAIAADKISSIYNIPLINKFELQGNEEDIKIFKERVDIICQNG
jgi:protein involved in ribonucleotide reduction